MNKEEIKELVCKKLSNDLSFNPTGNHHGYYQRMRHPATLHHCDAAGYRLVQLA